jgi:hypothetical protein
MVDLDGTFEYSSVKEVTILGADLTLTDIKLNPNPSTDGKSQLVFGASNAGEITVEVYDMAGNNLLSGTYEVFAGNGNAIDLNLTNVASGMYNVVITSGNVTVTRSLNVVK